MHTNEKRGFRDKEDRTGTVLHEREMYADVTPGDPTFMVEYDDPNNLLQNFL